MEHGSPDQHIPNSDTRVGDEPSLEEYLGPFYMGDRLAEKMGITQEELSAMVTDGRLLELPTTDDKSVFPAWQFRDDMQPKPWLQKVVSELSAVECGSTFKAQWIKSFEDIFIGRDLSIDEWLKSGGDLQFVLAVARNDVERLTH